MMTFDGRLESGEMMDLILDLDGSGGIWFSVEDGGMEDIEMADQSETQKIEEIN